MLPVDFAVSDALLCLCAPPISKCTPISPGHFCAPPCLQVYPCISSVSLSTTVSLSAPKCLQHTSVHHHVSKCTPVSPGHFGAPLGLQVHPCVTSVHHHVSMASCVYREHLSTSVTPGSLHQNQRFTLHFYALLSSSTSTFTDFILM